MDAGGGGVRCHSSCLQQTENLTLRQKFRKFSEKFENRFLFFYLERKIYICTYKTKGPKNNKIHTDNITNAHIAEKRLFIVKTCSFSIVSVVIQKVFGMEKGEKRREVHPASIAGSV